MGPELQPLGAKFTAGRAIAVGAALEFFAKLRVLDKIKQAAGNVGGGDVGEHKTRSFLLSLTAQGIYIA